MAAPQWRGPAPLVLKAPKLKTARAAPLDAENGEGRRAGAAVASPAPCSEPVPLALVSCSRNRPALCAAGPTSSCRTTGRTRPAAPAGRHCGSDGAYVVEFGLLCVRGCCSPAAQRSAAVRRRERHSRWLGGGTSLVCVRRQRGGRAGTPSPCERWRWRCVRSDNGSGTRRSSAVSQAEPARQHRHRPAAPWAGGSAPAATCAQRGRLRMRAHACDRFLGG